MIGYFCAVKLEMLDALIIVANVDMKLSRLTYSVSTHRSATTAMLLATGPDAPGEDTFLMKATC